MTATACHYRFLFFGKGLVFRSYGFIVLIFLLRGENVFEEAFFRSTVGFLGAILLIVWFLILLFRSMAPLFLASLWLCCELENLLVVYNQLIHSNALSLPLYSNHAPERLINHLYA